MQAYGVFFGFIVLSKVNFSMTGVFLLYLNPVPAGVKRYNRACRQPMEVTFRPSFLERHKQAGLVHTSQAVTWLNVRAQAHHAIVAFLCVDVGMFDLIAKIADFLTLFIFHFFILCSDGTHYCYFLYAFNRHLCVI